MVDTIEQEERILEKDREEEKIKKEKMWKTIGVIFLIFGIILLVVWASSSKNFKIFPFLGGVGVVLILFVGMFWGVGIYRRMQELQEKNKGLGKLPPPVTISQARELIKEQMQSPEYCDIVQSWKQHRVYNLGVGTKNRILVVQLDMVYETSPYQFFLMNLHFPKELWDYVCQEKYNPSEITRLANALSVSPEDEPDQDIIEEENPMTGIKRRVISTHKQKEEKKDEKGDFR